MSVTSRQICALFLLLSTTLQADNLTIPGHYESDRSIVMPQRGISMDQVLSDYGEPMDRHDAIGEPPITEWVYDDFHVYFEFQTVLHSLNLKSLIMPR